MSVALAFQKGDILSRYLDQKAKGLNDYGRDSDKLELESVHIPDGCLAEKLILI